MEGGDWFTCRGQGPLDPMRDLPLGSKVIETPSSPVVTSIESDTLGLHYEIQKCKIVGIGGRENLTDGGWEPQNLFMQNRCFLWNNNLFCLYKSKGC
jgi:hypothetical protein